jgi:hypothetical protein
MVIYPYIDWFVSNFDETIYSIKVVIAEWKEGNKCGE